MFLECDGSARADVQQYANKRRYQVVKCEKAGLNGLILMDFMKCFKHTGATQRVCIGSLLSTFCWPSMNILK